VNKRIVTDKAPPAIGPYSQAMGCGDLVFCSGQIPLDETGQMLEGGIAEQTRQALANISAVLQAASLSMRDVVKTTVFMTDLAQFAEMNAVYQEFFPVEPPARSAVQVAALPRDALVEIEAVAFRPTSERKV